MGEPFMSTPSFISESVSPTQRNGAGTPAATAASLQCWPPHLHQNTRQIVTINKKNGDLKSPITNDARIKAGE